MRSIENETPPEVTAEALAEITTCTMRGHSALAARGFTLNFPTNLRGSVVVKAIDFDDNVRSIFRLNPKTLQTFWLKGTKAKGLRAEIPGTGPGTYHAVGYLDAARLWQATGGHVTCWPSHWGLLSLEFGDGSLVCTMPASDETMREKLEGCVGRAAKSVPTMVLPKPVHEYTVDEVKALVQQVDAASKGFVEPAAQTDFDKAVADVFG